MCIRGVRLLLGHHLRLRLPLAAPLRLPLPLLLLHLVSPGGVIAVDGLERSRPARVRATCTATTPIGGPPAAKVYSPDTCPSAPNPPSSPGAATLLLLLRPSLHPLRTGCTAARWKLWARSRVARPRVTVMLGLDRCSCLGRRCSAPARAGPDALRRRRSCGSSSSSSEGNSGGSIGIG